MDEYDVIDFVFEAVNASGTGFPVYKDKSPAGESGNHIVLNSLPWNRSDDFINSGYVNVNIFVKLFENGMINRQIMKTATRLIEPALKSISNDNNGKYRECEVIWGESIPELKEGFDCKNFRVLIKTDK